LITPRGSIIISAADPEAVAQDLAPIFLTEIISQFQEDIATPKEVRFIASSIRKLANWRDFFCFLTSAPIHNKPKLLTHNGHGSVSILLSDIPLG
jgi:hypothetical protein